MDKVLADRSRKGLREVKSRVCTVCHHHKTLDPLLLHGLLDLHDALGLLGLLGVSMAGYVHPSLAPGVGPPTEAICHSVVLPRDVYDAVVELGERLMPSGPPCRRSRGGVDVLLVPALQGLMVCTNHHRLQSDVARPLPERTDNGIRLLLPRGPCSTLALGQDPTPERHGYM